MDKAELPVEELRVSDKVDFLYQFLCRHSLAALATADLAGNPEAAIVEFSPLPNLELVFDTYSTFRKYRNLVVNREVALVVGWDKNITVQYEGQAIELSGEELLQYRALHLKRFPDAIRFEDYFGMKYFKVVPRWLRYTDLSQIPWNRVELTFDRS